MSNVQIAINELERQLKAIEMAIKSLKHFRSDGRVNNGNSLSPEGRERIAAAQRRRWAAHRRLRRAA